MTSPHNLKIPLARQDLLFHQASTVDFINRHEKDGKNWGLYSDMGTGKTKCIISVLLAECCHCPTRQTLVVAPACIVKMWRSTCAQNQVAHMVQVISYSCLINKKSSIAAKCYNEAWHRVVLDEAHLVRNRRSARNAAVSRLKSKHRGCMTGTPLIKSVADMNVLAAWLGNEPDDQDGWIRYTLSDIIDDLPTNLKPPGLKKYHHNFHSTRDLEIQKVHHESIRELGNDPFRISERKAILSHDIGGATNTSAYGILPDTKLQVVYSIVLDSTKHPTRCSIIFTNFIAEMKMIANGLHARTSRPIRTIDGSVSVSNRHRIFQEANLNPGKQYFTMCASLTTSFKHINATAPRLVRKIMDEFVGPTGQILVMQQATGSVGLNLQMYTTAVFANPSWCPLDDSQAICRMYRMGQRACVEAHWVSAHLQDKMINTATTMEKTIAHMERKQIMVGKQNQIVDSHIQHIRDRKIRAVYECLNDDHHHMYADVQHCDWISDGVGTVKVNQQQEHKK